MDLNHEWDAIIVGSGPTGVSVAFPLVEAGLRVLLVDGGKEPQVPSPAGYFLDLRANDPDQWAWMIGRDYYALRKIDALSPKFRAPTHGYVFDGFEAGNRIRANDFVTIGSLSRGGLSNAWGCSISRLQGNDLASFPFTSAEIDPSYEIVSRRIGISGASDDDLSDYFGVDAWATAPVPTDRNQARILERYSAHRADMHAAGFRLGRSRLAVLTEDLGERKACDLSGTCLWGCHRKSLYSAAGDLAALVRHPNFHYLPGFIVEKIASEPHARTIFGRDKSGHASFHARRLILAAGTLASTRLALHALRQEKPVELHCCPIGAFLLWTPSLLGRRREAEFGLGQLSFTLAIREGVTGFGTLYSMTGLPVSEFVRYMPIAKRYGIDLLTSLLSSCTVSNMFLPGHMTRASVAVSADGTMAVEGEYTEAARQSLAEGAQKLRRIFWKLGAILLPTSFKLARAGGDIHYSCTMPMRAAPSRGETTPEGEIAGLEGVYVVDGACLPYLHEKSHTLTLMANADRIGRAIAQRLPVSSS